MLRRLSLFLSALGLLTACASPTEANGPAKPGMWQIADEDTTIYLFGTIHMLPPDYSWRTKNFDKAVSKADELVLEVVMDKDPAKTAAIMNQLGRSPGLPPLLDRVPAERRAELEQIIAKAKLPLDFFDGMETWAAATTLAATTLAQANIRSSQGVETQLSTSFEQAGKSIAGLETTEQQLGYFDGLSEEVQRKFLLSVIDSSKDAEGEFKKMVAAWASGDTKKIAVTFDDEMQLTPELSEILLKRRNQNWVEWMKKRMDQPGTILVAVGAGHLAGKDSVQEMLKAEGYEVKRVQ